MGTLGVKTNTVRVAFARVVTTTRQVETPNNSRELDLDPNKIRPGSRRRRAGAGCAWPGPGRGAGKWGRAGRTACSLRESHPLCHCCPRPPDTGRSERGTGSRGVWWDSGPRECVCAHLQGKHGPTDPAGELRTQACGGWAWGQEPQRGNPGRKGLNTAVARLGEAEAGGELRCPCSWLQSSRPHTSPCPRPARVTQLPRGTARCHGGPGGQVGAQGGSAEEGHRVASSTACPGSRGELGKQQLVLGRTRVSGGTKLGRHPPETSLLSRPQGEVLILTLSSRVSLGGLERCVEDEQISRAGDDRVESIPNLVSLENRSF